MNFVSHSILCIISIFISIKIFYKDLDAKKNDFIMSSISAISFIITTIILTVYACNYFS